MKWFKRWVEKRFYKIHPELYCVSVDPTIHISEVRIVPIKFDSVLTVYDEECIPQDIAIKALKNNCIRNVLDSNKCINIREVRDEAMHKTDYYARISVLPIEGDIYCRDI